MLKDKRKKLRETFERILRLYEKENPDIYKELRKLEVEYEQKRSQLSQYFDAVKVISSTLNNIASLIVLFALLQIEIAGFLVFTCFTYFASLSHIYISKSVSHKSLLRMV